MQQLELVPHLLYEPEYETGILWIKFNRPERMNAELGGASRQSTWAKLGEYMRAGDDDPQIRFIVLTGVGRAFCAGADLKGNPEFDHHDNFIGNRPNEGADATREGFFYGITKLITDISYIRKPTIAMVNGPAAGGGMDAALACDIRYGCENSRFLTYHQVGQIIENGGLYWLPRLAGFGRAMEFAYTGVLDAERAYRWGILNELVPSEQLEAEVRALCARMSNVPPITHWLNKRIMRTALDTTLEATRVLTSNAALIPTTAEDRQESKLAFREKRAPQFKGR